MTDIRKKFYESWEDTVLELNLDNSLEKDYVFGHLNCRSLEEFKYRQKFTKTYRTLSRISSEVAHSWLQNFFYQRPMDEDEISFYFASQLLKKMVKIRPEWYSRILFYKEKEATQHLEKLNQYQMFDFEALDWDEPAFVKAETFNAIEYHILSLHQTLISKQYETMAIDAWRHYVEAFLILEEFEAFQEKRIANRKKKRVEVQDEALSTYKKHLKQRIFQKEE